MMEIKILGTGCPKCKTLEKLTRDVVEQNGIDATVTKVEDIMEIMKYGVMTTPALVVNGKVEIKGRVPSSSYYCNQRFCRVVAPGTHPGGWHGDAKTDGYCSYWRVDYRVAAGIYLFTSVLYDLVWKES